MTDTAVSLPTEIVWGDDALRLVVALDEEGRARLVALGRPGEPVGAFDTALPLVEIVTPRRSRASGTRIDHTDLGLDLRYSAHAVRSDAASGEDVLDVVLCDPLSPLVATVCYAMRPGSGAVSASVRVENGGDAGAVVLLFVSSTALGDGSWGAEETLIHLADNDWLAESRWRSGTLAELGEPDVAMGAHAGARPRGCLELVGRGTWSTGAHLPQGALEAPDGRTLMWQVESNGGWRWQLARDSGGGPAGTLGLVTSGPDDIHHDWSVALEPGESFAGPVTTVAVSPDGFAGALARLTEHRRADHRAYAGDAGLPMIFNDYMNGLMADPTTEKLLPMIAAAGRAGAEIFVVDAGWYTDETGWWPTVGEWRPSTRRFPGGIDEVFDAIRAAGMTPGLWLEPEVVGVDSPVAAQLPDSAFFTRHGERLVDNGRYQLDFRHPAVVERLDGVLDRLIADHGIGYVKFDYNINPAHGTDQRAASPGDGLQRAARAFLDWIDALHRRHPDLIVEDCASGGMRADWLTVSRFALLSTSDQQDALRCVSVAASATTVVPPEHAGVWSYPATGMPTGEATTTLVNSLLRRPILSGRIDLLTDPELARVQEYVTAWKALRHSLPGMQSVWPLGLPAWEDAWVATGLSGPDAAYVAVWRRDADSPERVHIPLDGLAATGDDGPGVDGSGVSVEVVFPADTTARWHVADGELAVALDAVDAVVLRVR